MRSPIRRLVVAAALLLVADTVAHATDGVVEINQTCAATGCFAGDAPGLPVTLATSGAYRLTSNLSPGGSEVAAIHVTSAASRGVDLDLNGFALTGPGTCTTLSASPWVQCTLLILGQVGVRADAPTTLSGGVIAGLDVGILGSSGVVVSMSELSISDTDQGVVAPFGTLEADGISVRRSRSGCIVGGTVTLIRSRIADCGQHGIFATGLAISDSRVERAGNGDAVQGGDSTSIDRTQVLDSHGNGIRCDRNCQVTNSLVAHARQNGIVAGIAAVISGNGLDYNEVYGIDASDASQVSRNTIQAATALGANFGIRCGVGCNVVENLVRNAETALDLGSFSRYSRNVISLYFDFRGGVSGNDNLCNGANC